MNFSSKGDKYEIYKADEEIKHSMSDEESETRKNINQNMIYDQKRITLPQPLTIDQQAALQNHVYKEMSLKNRSNSNENLVNGLGTS